MSEQSQSLQNVIRFVFLDRDGVVNRKMPEGEWVTMPAQFEMLEGVAEAIATLNRLDIKVIIVTNQRGIADGLYSEEQLTGIHEHLRELLAKQSAHVDAIYYCPHERNACDCRKPKTGMFLQAFAAFPGASPANSLMVGDSLSDIEAGSAIGMPTAFIEVGAHQSPGASKARTLATYRAASLSEFVRTWFG